MAPIGISGTAMLSNTDHDATGFIRIDQDGAIARLVLDRPDRGHSWLARMWDEATDGIRRVNENQAVRVVLIESTGDRIFSGGADLDELRTLGAGADAQEAVGELLGRVERFLSALERSPKIVIGVISGAAMGAGMEIASACDVRIASTTAKFGIPAARLGIVITRPDVARLARIAGASLAYNLLLTARSMSATEALQHGIVSAIHAPEHLAREAELLATRVAELSPHSLLSMKRHLLVVSSQAPASSASFADSIAGLLSDELRAALSARKPATETAG